MLKVLWFCRTVDTLYLSPNSLTLTLLTNQEKVEFRVVAMTQVRLRGAPNLTTEEAGVTVMLGESNRGRTRKKKRDKE